MKCNLYCFQTQSAHVQQNFIKELAVQASSMLPEEKFRDPQLEQKDAPDEAQTVMMPFVRTVKVLRFLQASCRQRD